MILVFTLEQFARDMINHIRDIDNCGRVFRKQGVEETEDVVGLRNAINMLDFNPLEKKGAGGDNVIYIYNALKNVNTNMNKIDCFNMLATTGEIHNALFTYNGVFSLLRALSWCNENVKASDITLRLQLSGNKNRLSNVSMDTIKKLLETSFVHKGSLPTVKPDKNLDIKVTTTTFGLNNLKVAVVAFPIELFATTTGVIDPNDLEYFKDDPSNAMGAALRSKLIRALEESNEIELSDLVDLDIYKSYLRDCIEKKSVNGFNTYAFSDDK